jgi:(p)ppGpp synthase/HD superfamily hydrolase
MLDSRKVLQARTLAEKSHAGQTRKFTGEPYIIHPVQIHAEVHRFLVECGLALSETTITTMECAALLHDVLEDCPQISEQEIVDATDGDVLALVKELTNPSKSSKAPRAVRKQMDRDHLQHVSWEAKVIKLIDRTCNLGDMAQCPDKNFVRLYASESKLLLACLQGTHPALEDQLQEMIRLAFLSAPSEGIVMRNGK